MDRGPDASFITHRAITILKNELDCTKTEVLWFSMDWKKPVDAIFTRCLPKIEVSLKKPYFAMDKNHQLSWEHY